MDTNAKVNGVVVVGLIVVCVVLSAGTFVLGYLGKAAPEGVVQLLSTITGGLVGYLARDSTKTPPVAPPPHPINRVADRSGDGV